MKFGKLSDISNVTFNLPEDPPKTLSLIRGLSRSNNPPEIYIGCTGWSMKEWIGKVYPQGAKSREFLKYYSNQFNTIELNTTHYRIPEKETIRKWRSEVPDDFRFCPKLPQSISHSKDMGIESGQLKHFTEVIQGLEGKLGCCFMQLPPYFGYDRLGILKHFLEIFPSHIPLAVEIRHESWFDNEENSLSYFQLLENFNVSAVITDVAGRRDVLHQRITNDTAMIRFVGNGLHPTDYTRIDEWVQKIKDWTSLGLKKIFFFPHEPDNILAPDLSLYLLNQIKAADMNPIVRGPRFIDDSEAQLSLF